MLKSSRYTSLGQLVATERIDRSYFGKMLQLTLLAPDLAEAALDGRPPPELGLPMLLGSLPPAWAEQRASVAGPPAASS
ncbi:hypothetical protein JYK14_24245 [Siccirubricoccus sp. KC 17139]|uniref:Uncharacterized protein n=1 Tax=Siccirubricoccus soli TaxID=2899147 RepID=A0ABT1DBC7_9PROT|nr:hypothetical protein [Siccirubricoccus soli]MCO6419248.1 hypothetical protein [Siccirubricoccus soli]MCP2685383.1 hypothetical protein [Siccirubricoccus soli]